MEVVGVLVILGMVASILMGVSQKHGLSGPIGTVLGVLLLPSIIALLWHSAAVFGWWTIAIFFVLSLVVGYALVPVRRNNPLTLVYMQPLFGLSATGLAIACWFVG